MTEETEEFSDTRQRAIDLRKGGHTYEGLNRKMLGDYVTFWLSAQGAKALELDGLKALEPGRQN